MLRMKIKKDLNSLDSLFIINKLTPVKGLKVIERKG